MKNKRIDLFDALECITDGHMITCAVLDKGPYGDPLEIRAKVNGADRANGLAEFLCNCVGKRVMLIIQPVEDEESLPGLGPSPILADFMDQVRWLKREAKVRADAQKCIDAMDAQIAARKAEPQQMTIDDAQGDAAENASPEAEAEEDLKSVAQALEEATPEQIAEMQAQMDAAGDGTDEETPENQDAETAMDAETVCEDGLGEDTAATPEQPLQAVEATTPQTHYVDMGPESVNLDDTPERTPMDTEENLISDIQATLDRAEVSYPRANNLFRLWLAQNGPKVLAGTVSEDSCKILLDIWYPRSKKDKAQAAPTEETAPAQEAAPSLEIPALTSYLREGDIIVRLEEKRQAGSEVKAVTLTHRAPTNDGWIHGDDYCISNAALDEGYRLKLCMSTINEQDKLYNPILADLKPHRVALAGAGGVKLVCDDLDFDISWDDLDKNYRMLSREGIDPFAD